MAAKGFFCVFEGADRVGKTTQIARLEADWADVAGEAGETTTAAVTVFRVPNVSSETGKLISRAVKAHGDEGAASRPPLPPETVHLLFAADRWETAAEIRPLLNAGHAVVCDRWAHSGLAYSAARGLDVEWCRASDRGLPEPDLVLLFKLAPEEAARRGGYGTDRDENVPFQTAVVKEFARCLSDAPSRVVEIDAGDSEEEVAAHVRAAIVVCLRERRATKEAQL
jgi:dTMP kinase